MESFDFVSPIGKRLGIRAEANGIESLSEAEQVVLLICWASGIIGNGGFRYFYEGATNTEQVANAYEALGFANAAQACRETLAIFPPNLVAEGFQSCQKWLDAHYSDGELSHLFEDQDAVIWEIDDSLPAVLAAYITRHQSEFQALE